MLGAAGGGNGLKASRVGRPLPNPRFFLGVLPGAMLPDRQMATTWNAHFRPEMDACEGHKDQSQALIQYAPSKIPIGVLFPQLMALSLEPQHYFLAPARAPALISKVGHSKGLRPLPPTPKTNCRWDASNNAE